MLQKFFFKNVPADWTPLNNFLAAEALYLTYRAHTLTLTHTYGPFGMCSCGGKGVVGEFAS